MSIAVFTSSDALYIAFLLSLFILAVIIIYSSVFLLFLYLFKKFLDYFSQIESLIQLYSATKVITTAFFILSTFLTIFFFISNMLTFLTNARISIENYFIAAPIEWSFIILLWLIIVTLPLFSVSIIFRPLTFKGALNKN